MEESAYTFYFEEIFPNYEEWKDFIETYSDAVDYNDPSQALFDKWCYSLLARHYNHCNIRYTVPGAFKGELLNVYENKFKQFMQEKMIVDKIHSLKAEDYELMQTNLTNMANNPNYDIEDPIKPLKFISAQTYQVVNSNKLRAYLDALNNMPSLKIFKFFKAPSSEEMGFDDLFMNIQPNQKYVYERGQNEHNFQSKLFGPSTTSTTKQK